MSIQDQLIELYDSFKKILDEHKLWHIATSGTLLGAIRERKMIEWDDDIDLGISIETYHFLKEKYPNNILDTDVKGYPFLFPKWVPDVNNFMNSNIFLDLFIFVPTTKKRIKKYSQFKNVLCFSNQMFNKGSLWKPYNFKLKLLKAILWPIQWTTKKLKIDNIISILHENDKEKIECTIMVNAPNSKINNETFVFDIFKRKETKFGNTKIWVPIEFDQMLINIFGSDYMTPRYSIGLQHIDPINTKEKE